MSDGLFLAFVLFGLLALLVVRASWASDCRWRVCQHDNTKLTDCSDEKQGTHLELADEIKANPGPGIAIPYECKPEGADWKSP